MTNADPLTIRKCIEEVGREEIRMYLKAVYLTASLPMELAGELTAQDIIDGRHPEPIGPTGNDVFLTEIEMPDQRLTDVLGMLERIRKKECDVEQIEKELMRKIPIAVFKITNVKKGDKKIVRHVALPMPKEYEPWTEDLYKYFKQRKNDFVFPFSRQDVSDKIRNKTFKGLDWVVIKYRQKVEQFALKREKHNRPFGLQAMRYVRTFELMENYSFDMLDLTEFVGLNPWLSNTPIRYEKHKTTHDNWQRYIKKLCRPLLNAHLET